VRFWPVVLSLVSGCSGCTGCSSCSSCSAPSAANGDAAITDAGLGNRAPAPLSLPIAAAATTDGAVIVAGLVAARKAVIAERHEGDRVTWVVDAQTDVTWSADLELRVVADSAGGAAIVVRSSASRLVHPVDKDGKIGAAFPSGAAVCASERGLARVEPSGHVILRSWAGADVGDTEVPADRDAILVCAQNEVYVLAEGEDDVVLMTVPQRGTPLKIVPDLDDERERAPFTAGDILGVVEVGREGAARVVRVADGGTSSARIKKNFAEEDDLETVDGDDKTTFLAFSREAAARCAGTSSMGTDVLVLRVSPAGEEEREIVKGDCGKDLDPFRLDAIKDGALLAWAERSPKRAPTDPPIDAVMWAKIADGPIAPVKTPARGEGIAFAGCAKDRCHVVVLERPPGTDGMQPGTAKIVSYP
jgi:hypothetical protein